MAKAFFALFLLFVAGMAWMIVPRAIKRTCPVCQGRGSFPAPYPIVVGKGQDWVQKKELLCPFCNGGRISLYNLRLRRDLMIRWMVKEQKLPPELLVKRVRDAWGEAGLQVLHQNNFFMQGNDRDKNLPGG